MRAVVELTKWFFWAIRSGIWAIYHTLHSRKLGSLIIEPDTGDFRCRRCNKNFNFDVPWETIG